MLELFIAAVVERAKSFAARIRRVAYAHADFWAARMPQLVEIRAPI